MDKLRGLIRTNQIHVLTAHVRMRAKEMEKLKAQIRTIEQNDGIQRL
jgi:hypothetical protein